MIQQTSKVSSHYWPRSGFNMQLIHNWHHVRNFLNFDSRFTQLIRNWNQRALSNFVKIVEINSNLGVRKWCTCQGLKLWLNSRGKLTTKGRYNQGKNQGKDDGFCWFGMDMSREEWTQVKTHQENKASKWILTALVWHGRAYRHGMAVPYCCPTVALFSKLSTVWDALKGSCLLDLLGVV